MPYKKKILYGFSNIKVKKDDKELEVKGAISVSVDMSINTVSANSLKQTFTWSKVQEARGQMEVLSLTQEEQALIFGYELRKTNEETELIINDNFQFQEVELSFERQRGDNKTILYKMYVVFEPSSMIEANTISDSIEEDTTTLNFTVIKKDNVYYREIEK